MHVIVFGDAMPTWVAVSNAVGGARPAMSCVGGMNKGKDIMEFMFLEFPQIIADK
jgi:hypothetical protein